MSFDPNAHLRNLKGQMYLDVKWRLLWLREEHLDAIITTSLEQYRDDTQMWVFKAQVVIPGGGSATGHGQETERDFPAGACEKAECLELGAHILTRAGFKSHDQLLIGEDVLAYSVEDDRCHWTPLQAITVHDARPTIRLHSPWFEAIMTPDHSWATTTAFLSRTTGQPMRRLRKATELTSADRITLAAPTPGGDAPITPQEAAIIGWLFTDGSIWESAGSLDAKIYQSKQERVGQIRDLVGAHARETVGQPTHRLFPNGRAYDCLPQHVFHFPATFMRPLLERAGLESSLDLPSLVTRLSEQARWAMLDAMMAADGDERGYFGKIRKPGVMEAWQILCTLQGQAVGARRNEKVFPVQRAKARRFLSCSELQREDAGVRAVWCPTTSFGTWVCRLPNGQVSITGNTKAIGRALAALGYGTQFALDRDASESEGDRLADSPVQPAKAAPRPNQPRSATSSPGSPTVASATHAPSTPPASAPSGVASPAPASSATNAQPAKAENERQQALRLNARITELCTVLDIAPPQSPEDLAALGQSFGWHAPKDGAPSATWKEQLIVQLEIQRQRALVAAALVDDPDAAAKLTDAKVTPLDTMSAEELNKTLTWLQNRARRQAQALTEPASAEASEPTASSLGEPWAEPDVLNALAAATEKDIDGIAAEIGLSVDAFVLTEDLARQLRACVTLARRAFTVTAAGSMAQVEIDAGEMRTNLDLTVDQYDALIALTRRVRDMRDWVASNGATSRQAVTVGAGGR